MVNQTIFHRVVSRHDYGNERRGRVFHHFPSNTVVEFTDGGEHNMIAYPGSTLVLTDPCGIMNCDERQITSEGCNSSTGSAYSSPPSYQPTYHSNN